MVALIDLTGKKFGKLTVIERAERPEDASAVGVYWLCECDCEDKNRKVVHGGTLKSGGVKSCGCLRPNFKSPMGEKSSKKGTKKRNPDAVVNYLYLTYFHGSKKRNLSFEITKEEFKEIIQQNCYYCNKEPSNYVTIRSRDGGFYWYNGVDRLNNDKGYTNDNIVPCCKKCNLIKKQMTEDEFLSWVASVYKYSIEERHNKKYEIK
jgi:hypothetical protein